MEIHGHEHWSQFYTDQGVELQRRFFDYYLKGEGRWPETQPRVQLHIRQPDDTFVRRDEAEWPLARTDWRSVHLDARPAGPVLAAEPPARGGAVTYDPDGRGITFLGEPLDERVEITGPVSATLHISSRSADADLFLVLRAFAPDGTELLFRGAGDPFTPMAQGWLRASHRAIDPERSTPWRPVHRHDAIEPLIPDQIYQVEVEIWPTCLVLPAGYRIGLTVAGTDYDHGLTDDQMAATGRLGWSPRPTRGCGPYVHVDADDRDRDELRGEVTLHTGPEHPARLLLPVIPGVEERS